jgi:hypothetical protein
MPAPALHVGATVMCSHAGQAQPTAPFPRVLVNGQPIVTISCTYVVAGCALTGTTSPPCVTGQLTSGATRVTAGGAPVATLQSAGTCTPSGTPLQPVVAQARVMAT